MQYPTVQASSTAARLTTEGVGVAAARVAKAREARLAFILDVFEDDEFEQ